MAAAAADTPSIKAKTDRGTIQRIGKKIIAEMEIRRSVGRGLGPTAGEERETGTGRETGETERETAANAIDHTNPERRKVVLPRGVTEKIIIIKAKGVATKTEVDRKKNNAAAAANATEEEDATAKRKTEERKAAATTTIGAIGAASDLLPLPPNRIIIIRGMLPRLSTRAAVVDVAEKRPPTPTTPTRKIPAPRRTTPPKGKSNSR